MCVCVQSENIAQMKEHLNINDSISVQKQFTNTLDRYYGSKRSQEKIRKLYNFINYKKSETKQ